MRIHDCTAGDEAAFLVDIHRSVRQGPDDYRCEVPKGVSTTSVVASLKMFFPEWLGIAVNEEEGVILFRTKARPTIQ